MKIASFISEGTASDMLQLLSGSVAAQRGLQSLDPSRCLLQAFLEVFSFPPALLALGSNPPSALDVGLSLVVDLLLQFLQFEAHELFGLLGAPSQVLRQDRHHLPRLPQLQPLSLHVLLQHLRLEGQLRQRRTQPTRISLRPPLLPSPPILGAVGVCGDCGGGEYVDPLPDSHDALIEELVGVAFLFGEEEGGVVCAAHEQKLLMKEHNPLVRFKNSFIADPEKHERLTNILNQDLEQVLKEKISAVDQLYRAQAADNGYSPALAYRVLVLHLLAGKSEGLDLRGEVERFFRSCLGEQSLEGLRMCFDLLLLKELPKVMGSDIRLLKVRVLRGLRDHYQRSGLPREKRRCAHMLQEYCKDSLSREDIKRSPSSYSEILDALIEQTKRRVGRLVQRGARIVAAEVLGVFTQVLERSEQVVTRKYQLELLEAYWALALLHDQLHYLAYTRKYAAIALNIAHRTEHQARAKDIQLLLERLA